MQNKTQALAIIDRFKATFTHHISSLVMMRDVAEMLVETLPRDGTLAADAQKIADGFQAELDRLHSGGFDRAAVLTAARIAATRAA